MWDKGNDLSESTPLIGSDYVSRFNTKTSTLYSNKELASILEKSGAQSLILPMSVQPAVNMLIKFVEMHSIFRLCLFAAAAVAAAAFMLTAMLIWGDCLDGDSPSAVYLFMVTVTLGECLACNIFTSH